MKSSKLFYLIIFATLIGSCNTKSSGDAKGPVIVTSPKTNDAIKGAVIKNDIDLDVTGVKLKSVYLLDTNEKPLLENKARLGERIYVIVELDTGWVKENKKSFIGASERVLTKSRRVIVSADDIFKDYETTGIDAKDAEVIRLSAVITKPDSESDEFSVQFRIWDKKGTGEVKGKYNFVLIK